MAAAIQLHHTKGAAKAQTRLHNVRNNLLFNDLNLHQFGVRQSDSNYALAVPRTVHATKQPVLGSPHPRRTMSS